VRIGIQAWGSEGDIRPLIALGHGLVERGHDVELVYTDIADRNYEAVAAALGMRVRAVATPVVPDINETYRIGLKIISARDPLTQARIIFDEFLKPVERQLYEAATDLCARSDFLVGHFILHHLRAAAELAGKPEVSVTFAHTMLPSRHQHPHGAPRLGELGNIVEWRLARMAINLVMGRDINRFRNRIGLQPIKDLVLDGWASHLLNLIAVSPALCPGPPDWPPWNKVCGFLALPSTGHEAVSSELARFIADGPPPVFMGFGSLMPWQSSHLTETVALLKEAARLADCRAIIQAEVPPDHDDRVMIVSRTPHAQVFPQCAAVVHHCGAGTTHTTLKAGVPSLPVPHVSDQFQWADELRRVGVAPAAIPRRRLTAARLAARIREVMQHPRFRENASQIQARMKDDDGPRTAARLIDEARLLK
jgi:sterol 3beta-glucosyltransferase/vancomycin aglycone glucosyltransferase